MSNSIIGRIELPGEKNKEISPLGSMAGYDTYQEI